MIMSEKKTAAESIKKPDYTVKRYPDFVDTEHVKDDCDICKGCRFSLTIPFKGGEEKEFLRVIMKNPSTADSSRCDKTAFNVCNNAYYAGYGGVIILNLYPLQATKAGEVYDLFINNNERFEWLKVMNIEKIDELCNDADVVFAWGSNTIRDNKKFREEYDAMIAWVTQIVTQGCAKSALAISMPGAKYPVHPQRGWNNKYFLKETLEASELTDDKKKLTPDDEEYWRSHYCDRMINPELDKKRLVIHHNMFGPSAQFTAINNEDDYKIYCRKEHNVVKPNCVGCNYWYSDEMGNGRACLWDDYFDEEERIIPNDKKEKEFDRVDSDLNGPDDLFNN